MLYRLFVVSYGIYYLRGVTTPMTCSRFCLMDICMLGRKQVPSERGLFIGDCRCCWQDSWIFRRPSVSS